MSILSKVRLYQIMNTRFISVEADTSVEYLIKDYFSVHMKSAFPVTKTNGYLVGMVTLKNAMTVPEHRRQAMKADVMTPLIDLIVMNQNTKARNFLVLIVR